MKIFLIEIMFNVGGISVRKFWKKLTEGRAI
jgi:hypothetical protein